MYKRPFPLSFLMVQTAFGHGRANVGIYDNAFDVPNDYIPKMKSRTLFSSMFLRRSLTFVLVACLSLGVWATSEHLLPTPKSVTLQQGATLTLTGQLSVSTLPSARLQRAFLNLTGQTLTTTAGAPTLSITTGATISGAYDYTLEGYPNEAYQLTVDANGITIQAVTETGVIRAIQTLAQLAEGRQDNAIEACQITDWPAFKLRGLMHDIGRSFISVNELKQQIRLLGRFKVNTFHWHLTENQGWRFEVQQYPQLTAVSSMTRFAGQYYTQAECREIVSLAADYGITVIPEIDMPGHSGAFERAMGHSMQTDEGVAELKNILDEVADVFADAPYIHIGADEQTITYDNFLGIVTDYVHNLGKKVVVWNPIRGVTISSSMGADMTQMWSTSGTKISGLPNIDCRYNYVNHFDVFADLVGIYKSNIYYANQGSAEVAGEITAVWNDRYVEDEQAIMRQNNVYANVLASTERAWKGGGSQYIETGGTTLPNSGDEYEEFADWERRFLFHKANSLSEASIPYVRQTDVKWQITDAFPNGGVSTTILPPETEGPQDSYEYNGTTYGTGRATGAGIYLRHTWGTTVPSYYSSPQSNTTAYAWTYIYSPVAQEAGALIEFQNYGRSENDMAPENGKWDRKGSRIWFNDEEITGPTWDNAGLSISSEVPLKNENFTERQPVSIQLQKGWNKVFLKLPYVTASNVRLNKWMFTFVITDTEGKNALDGLKYSPKKILDEEAEAVSERIDEVRHAAIERTGTDPGFLPTSLTEELNNTLDAIEATLGVSMTAEQRSQQLATIEEAYETFLTLCSETTERVMPRVSEGDSYYWYTMCTPLRDSRYVQSNGADTGLTGGSDGTVTAAQWKFVNRSDGTYDIVNRSDGTYLSQSTVSGTIQLIPTTDSPSQGWTLKPAATLGYLIVTSGTSQLNMGNAGQSYKVFNWGSGTNTTDTGCQYAIRLCETVEPFQPQVSNTLVRHWYAFCTPLRDGRFVQSNGVGSGLTGGTDGTSAAAQWRFMQRTDGTYDIVNRSDASYLAPTAEYNTQLTTSSASPSQGWNISDASTQGYYIVTSGSVQLNQCNSGLGYKIYNWGSGTNTTDTGCQFSIAECDMTLCGDLTDDKRVQYTDIPRMVSLILSRQFDAYDRFVIDVNNDGQIGLADLTALINLILNQ